MLLCRVWIEREDHLHRGTHSRRGVLERREATYSLVACLDEGVLPIDLDPDIIQDVGEVGIRILGDVLGLVLEADHDARADKVVQGDGDETAVVGAISRT